MSSRKKHHTLPLLLAVAFIGGPLRAARESTAGKQPEAVAEAILEAWVGGLTDPSGAQAELARIIRDDPTSPLAEPAAEFLLRCRGYAADPRLGRDLVESLVQATGLHGLARRRLRLAAAGDAAATGDLEGWRRHLPTRQDPAHFLALGPLGDFADDQHRVKFPPETAGIDLGAQVPGTEGPRRWRPVERPWHRSRLDPTEGITRAEGAWYLLVQLRSPRPRPAWLCLRPRGSLEGWVNGRKAVDLDAVTERIPTRLLVGVQLTAGWNRILCKTTEADASTLGLSILDGTGRELADLVEEKGRVLHPLPAPAPPGATRPAPDATTLLTGEPGPWAGLLDCILLMRLGHPSRGLARAREHAQASSLPPAWLVLYGLQLLDARHLPADLRRNRCRAVLEKAATGKDSAAALARLFLANLLLNDDKGEEAIRLLRKLLQEHPDLYSAERLLARCYQRLRWQVEGRLQAKRIRSLAPRRTVPLLEEAARLGRLGDSLSAYELVKRAHRLNQGDTRILSRGRRLALALGRLEEAQAWLRKESTLDPGRVQLLAVAARLAELGGDLDRALELTRRLQGREPEEADHREREGELLLAAGRRDEALAAFARVLEQDPSRHQLRRRVASMEKRDWAPELAAFRPDTKEAMATFRMRDSYRESASILVVDHMAVKVFPDGSWVSEIHQLRRINDQQGVDSYGEVDTQGEILALRAWHPDGTVSEPINVEGTYEIPGLKPGCFIEELYRDTRSEARREVWDITDFVFASHDEPFLWSRLIVILPRSRRGEFRWGGGLPGPRITEKGDSLVYTFEVRNRRRVVAERLMPLDREVIPWTTYGEDRPAGEITRQLRERLVRGLRSTVEIDRATAQACRGRQGDLEKARAIHAFVHRHVPNRGGSPNPTSILLKREGERWFLLAAMLRSAGIPMQIGFAHGAAPGTDREPAPPFQNADTLSSWFQWPLLRLLPRDGTPSWHPADTPRHLPFGRFPANLAGAPVLLVEPEGAELTFLPAIEPATQAEFLVAGRIRLREGRQATGSFTLTFPGPLGWQLKEMMRQAPEDRRDQFVRGQLAPLFRGAILRSYQAAGLERDDAVMRIELELLYPNFLQREGGKPAIPTGILPAQLGLMVRRPTRVWPFVHRRFRVMKMMVTLDPGAAWKFRALPRDEMVYHHFLAWTLRFRLRQGALVVERDLIMRPGQVSPRDYPRLISVFRSIDEAESRKIILARKPRP